MLLKYLVRGTIKNRSKGERERTLAASFMLNLRYQWWLRKKCKTLAYSIACILWRVIRSFKISPKINWNLKLNKILCILKASWQRRYKFNKLVVNNELIYLNGFYQYHLNSPMLITQATKVNFQNLSIIRLLKKSQKIYQNQYSLF